MTELGVESAEFGDGKQLLPLPNYPTRPSDSRGEVGVGDGGGVEPGVALGQAVEQTGRRLPGQLSQSRPSAGVPGRALRDRVRVRV